RRAGARRPRRGRAGGPPLRVAAAPALRGGRHRARDLRRAQPAGRGGGAGGRRARGPRVLRGGLVQLEQMYQEIILDHYRSPHRAGLRGLSTAEWFQINPTCGDEITLRVKLDGSTGTATVADVSYETLGCAISQAS